METKTTKTQTNLYWSKTLLLTASIVGLVAVLSPPTCVRGGRSSPPASLAGDTILPPWAQPALEEAPEEPQGGVYCVYFDTREELAALAVHFDIWEVEPEDGYATIGLDAESATNLIAQGYRLELDAERTGQHLLGPPGYPCYRDVDQLYADLQQIALDHPDLTELSDYGDSWRKVHLGADQGYDLLVLKVTNSQIPGPKPRFFLMATIHARELTTPETAMYFVEYLLDNHGNDPDATWIVDYHEVYVIVVTNPDGRQLVEQGCMHRKNRNDTLGSCPVCDLQGFNHHGVDLNRNYPYHWGGAGTNPCEQTYQGTAATSEPETYHLIDLARSIIPDQRPDDDTSPAPIDTTGLLISLHSYSNLVLWPWGWTYSGAPNEAQLRTLGRKLAYFNGYTPEQASDLYTTTGDTTDWAYGELGIPAYTFELGESFFQSCADLQQIMDENLGALLYAAKAPRTPYLTSQGPDVTSVGATPADILDGWPIHLTASIDDTCYNNSRGAEPTQNVTAAEYYIDAPPWVTTTTPISHAMTAVDGVFDETIEKVEATLDTAGLDPGRHIIFVRGRDALGYWGPLSAVFVNVQLDSVIAGHVSDADSGAPVGGASLHLDNGSQRFDATTDGSGHYVAPVLSGTYTVTAGAFGYVPQAVGDVIATTGLTTTQNFPLTAAPTGTLSGFVREWGTNAPLTATLSIHNTSITATSDLSGAYRVALPSGVYTVTASAPAHTSHTRAGLVVTAAQTTTADFLLPVPVDLRIGKVASSPSVWPGDLLTYTLTLTNHSPIPLTDLAATDTLPSGLDSVSASPAAVFDSGQARWSGLTMTAESTLTLTLVTQVNLRPGGTLGETLIRNADYRAQAAQMPAPVVGAYAVETVVMGWPYRVYAPLLVRDYQ